MQQTLKSEFHSLSQGSWRAQWRSDGSKWPMFRPASGGPTSLRCLPVFSSKALTRHKHPSDLPLHSEMGKPVLQSDTNNSPRRPSTFVFTQEAAVARCVFLKLLRTDHIFPSACRVPITQAAPQKQNPRSKGISAQKDTWQDTASLVSFRIFKGPQS